ncbi:putative protein phosphatase 2C 27 [Platanthera guangdongensis]|uniref:protein-serine/threonine phosphatase n=1 Tax=Platanthera guangdongensis TaxID=2320717 RepID=A0ABR2M244_9ASPA
MRLRRCWVLAALAISWVLGDYVGSQELASPIHSLGSALPAHRPAEPIPNGIRFYFSLMSILVSTHGLSFSQDSDLGFPSLSSSLDDQTGFLPVFRSGSCLEIGLKQYMEDEHICIDYIVDHLGTDADLSAPGAFYRVFDGHGGTDAVASARKNLLKFITEDQYFPTSVEKAMRSAFVMADHAFADSRYLYCSSGTTILATLIFGRFVRLSMPIPDNNLL